MIVNIRDIDDQSIKDLFSPCSGCIYWEAPEKFGKDDRGEPKVTEHEAIKIKRDWFKRTQEIFASCGKILYVDGKAVGYSQYAPPGLVEHVAEYSQELFPPSPDAILISCLYIREGHQGRGLGDRLLQAVIKNLRERDYQAVETYSRDDSANNCSGPTKFYLKNGFKLLKTKRWENATFSLMRLGLKKRR